MEGSGYGYEPQGSGFDPKTFFKQPRVILRLLDVLFAIIVFGTISDKAVFNLNSDGADHCLFHNNSDACNMGIAIGVLAFLFATALLFLHAMEAKLSQHQRMITTVNMAFSALWTFLWFVTFCFLAAMWSKTNKSNKDLFDTASVNAAQSAIAFSFFSILSWGAGTFLTFKEHRDGGGGGGSGWGSSPDSANTYSTYSGGGSGQGEFAPPPFTGDSSAYPATQ